jgi:hypothetical protein
MKRSNSVSASIRGCRSRNSTGRITPELFEENNDEAAHNAAISQVESDFEDVDIVNELIKVSQRIRRASLPTLFSTIKNPDSANSIHKKIRPSMQSLPSTVVASCKISPDPALTASGKLATSSSKILFKGRREASISSRISFSYLNEIMHEGAVRNVKSSEYPDVEINDESDFLTNQILSGWKIEQKNKGENAKLISVLWKLFGTNYMLTGIAYFIESILKISQAYLLGLLLNWIQEDTLEKPMYGYIYAGSISLVVFLQAFLNQMKHFW